jgi:hypothetical protein
VTASAVAPLLMDVEQPRTTAAISIPAETIDVVDDKTRHQAICASLVILACLVAALVVMNWLCCAG